MALGLGKGVFVTGMPKWLSKSILIVVSGFLVGQFLESRWKWPHMRGLGVGIIMCLLISQIFTPRMRARNLLYSVLIIAAGIFVISYW